MARHQGVRRKGELAFLHHQVSVAYAARAHTDQYFACSWLRQRAVLNSEIGAWLLEHHRFHGALPIIVMAMSLALSPRSRNMTEASSRNDDLRKADAGASFASPTVTSGSEG